MPNPQEINDSCKIVKRRCADNKSGSMGKCRDCPYGWHPLRVGVPLTNEEVQFLEDLCGDDSDIASFLSELIRVDIEDLRRRVKRRKGN